MALERTRVEKQKEILAMKARGDSIKRISQCLGVCHKL